MRTSCSNFHISINQRSKCFNYHALFLVSIVTLVQICVLKLCFDRLRVVKLFTCMHSADTVPFSNKYRLNHTECTVFCGIAFGLVMPYGSIMLMVPVLYGMYIYMVFPWWSFQRQFCPIVVGLTSACVQLVTATVFSGGP